MMELVNSKKICGVHKIRGDENGNNTLTEKDGRACMGESDEVMQHQERGIKKINKRQRERKKKCC